MNRRGIIRARFLALFLILFLICQDNSMSVLASGIAQSNDDRKEAFVEEGGEETTEDVEETTEEDVEETTEEDVEETTEEDVEETTEEDVEETTEEDVEETTEEDVEETTGPDESATGQPAPLLLTRSVATYAASATGTTALYIKESTSGDSSLVDISKDAAGTGWSWNAADGILTLSGYNGGGITAAGDLTIKLDGSNTITVNTANTYGIKVESGDLIIDKTDSDTENSLTVQTSGDGICAGRLIEAKNKTTVNGGTLNLLVKEGDNSVNKLVEPAIYMKNASILNSTVENANSTVPYVASSLFLDGSGKTTIKAKGDADFITAALDLYIGGTGDVSIEAINIRTKDGKACPAETAVLRGYSGTSKLTAKGMVRTANVDIMYSWPGDIDVTNAPEGGWLLYFINKSPYLGTYICDYTGTPLQEVIIEKKESVDFSFTDSDVWDIPAMQVGDYYYGSYLAGGIHGAQLHWSEQDYNDVKFSLKSGQKLPDGLVLGNSNISRAQVYGSPTKTCDAGEVIIVAKKRSTNEEKEFTIKYGAISEKDTFITIAGTKYNRKNDVTGTNWSYDAEGHILNLTGYNGAPIISEGDLNIKLSGENTITVSTDNTACISLTTGKLTIDKTNSDEADSLTLTTDGSGIKADNLINANTTVNGGTLNLKLLTQDTCNDSYLVDYSLYMMNASVLNSDVISTDKQTPRVAGQLYLRGSGKTMIKAKGYAGYIIAASAAISGSGDIDIEAINTKTTDAKPCMAIAADISYVGTSKLTTKGFVRVTNVSAVYGWPGNIDVTNAPEGGWLSYYINNSPYPGTYICDNTGTPLSDPIIEKKDDVDFSFVDSDVWNIPLLKMGEYYSGPYFAGSVHGADLHCQDSSINKVSFKVKEGDKLPDGLVLGGSNTSSAHVYGTPTKTCDAGDVTLVATHKDTGATKEITIHYDGVTVAKPVTGVNLSAATVNLAEKGSTTLTATVTPEDASISTVTFTSSDTNVAKVTQAKDSNTATITAVGPGAATITATTTQGGLTKTCAVTVTPDTPSITFDVYNNILLGFTAGRGYKITDKSTGEVLKEIPDSSTAISVSVENSWFGKTLEIVQTTGGVSSDACEVIVAHVYKTTYTYDATKHWKTCSCGAKTEEEEHVFEWVIDIPATETADGIKHKECICKYVDQSSRNTIISASQLAGITLNGITAPVVGATPDVEVESADATRYTIGGTTWRDDDTSLSEGTVFVENNEYILDVEIKLQGAYAFPAELSEVAIGLGGIDSAAISSKSIILKEETTKTYTVSIAFTTLKNKVELTDENTTVTGLSSYEYNGINHTPIPCVKVTIGSETKDLVMNTDYTVDYSDNREPGSATVTITGTGQYRGTLTKHFTIYRPISELSLQTKEYDYTGEAIDPTADLVLKDRGKILSQESDYVVDKIENNTDPGYMKITIKGGSNGYYTGTYTFTDKIRILPPMYTITVTNGKAYDIAGNEITSAPEGARVTIKANEPALGRIFDEWIINSGLITIGNTKSEETFFMMPGSTISVEATYCQLEALYAAPIDDQYYTGSAIKVLPEVYDGSIDNVLLVNKKDYMLSYKNNTNVGEATVTVTGKGNYKDKKTLTFNILPHDITAPQNTLYVDLSNNKTKLVTPSVKTLINGKTKTLSNNKDYILTYNYEKNEVFDSHKEYKVTATGKGNYEGTIEYKIVFIPKAAPKMSKAKVSLEYSKIEYDGTNKEPSVKVVLNKAELDSSSYTVEYKDNKDVGKATVTVTGNGTDLYGTKTLTFSITGKSLSSVAQFDNLPATVYYTGDELRPDFKLVLKKAVGDKAAGYELIRGTDYELVGYKKNVNPGDATVTVKGIGLFTGTMSKKFKIAKTDLAEGITTIECSSEAYFTKDGAVPAMVVVKQGDKVLDPQTEYKLSYKNNKKIGTATITVTGKGGYRKSVSKEYQVVQSSFADAITITASDVKAGTRYNQIKVTVKDGKTKLSSKDDYSISYALIGEGGAEIPVTDLKGSVESGADIQITVTAKQGRNYEAGTSKSICIHAGTVSISKAKVKISAQDYTGKEIKPVPSEVKYKDSILTLGTDYIIKGYSKNVDQGNKATVTIQGIGDYYGTTTVKFTIQKKNMSDNWSTMLRSLESLLSL